MCNGCVNLSFEIICKLTQRWAMGKHHTFWGFWILPLPPFTEFLTGLKSIFHLQYLSESGKPQWYQSMVSHKERLTFLWSLCEKSMVWFNFSKARKRRELGFLFKNNTRFSFIRLKWSFSFLELNWMFFLFVESLLSSPRMPPLGLEKEQTRMNPQPEPLKLKS